MGIKETVAKGVIWSTTQAWGIQAISFLVFMVLARTLGPESFGLIALASVFTDFIQIFLNQGMGQAIVQRVDLTPEHLDTAFWVDVLTSGLLTVCGIAMSGLIADLFNEPRLAPIVALLSLNFILSALSSTQKAIFQRKLDFKSLALSSIIAKVCGGAAGIGAALFGLGVWSLVIQYFVGGLVGVVVLWQISDWRPSLRISGKHFKELFTFGIHVVGKKILDRIDTRLDDLLIGYFLGPVALGYYTIAYQLLRAIQNLITNVSSTVAFPTFSHLQTDPKRLRHFFYQATEYTMLVAFPVFFGVAILAPELITILFGTQWLPSIPVMRILALAGLPIASFRFSGNLAMALGKPSWLLVSRLLSTTVRIIGLFFAVQWGIVAVATAVVIATYVLVLPFAWIAHRLVCLDRTYFSLYTVPLMSSLVMIINISGLKSISVNWIDTHYLLAIYTLAGCTTYLMMVRLIQPLLFGKLLNIAHIVLPKTSLIKRSIDAG